MRKIGNPEEFRENIVNKLTETLNNIELSRDLEKGVYEYAKKEANSLKLVIKWDNPYFTQLYTDRLRSIYINLKNEDLLNRLKTGDINGDISRSARRSSILDSHSSIARLFEALSGYSLRERRDGTF